VSEKQPAKSDPRWPNTTPTPGHQHKHMTIWDRRELHPPMSVYLSKERLAGRGAGYGAQTTGVHSTHHVRLRRRSLARSA